MRAALALTLTLACVGCLDTVGPEVGPPLRPICNNEDSDPNHQVRFDADIRAGLFARVDIACTRCHTPQGATPIGLQIGGLDLSTYASLRAGGVQSHDNIIKPGDPCGSVLLQKLGAAPPFGAQMPLGGPPYLDASDLQTISDWIAEGAKDD